MLLQRIAGWSLLVPAFLVLIVDLHRMAQPGRHGLLSLEDGLNSIGRGILGMTRSILPKGFTDHLLDPLLTLPAGLVLLMLALLALNAARRAQQRQARQQKSRVAERMFIS